MQLRLLLGLALLPHEALSSGCNATLSGHIVYNSSCELRFANETVVDFESRSFYVQHLPLDLLSCSRYWLQTDNAVLQNGFFYVNATIDYNWICEVQLFGLFDVSFGRKVKLRNITVAGQVYIEEGVSFAAGAVFCSFGMNLNPQAEDIVIPGRNSEERAELALGLADDAYLAKLFVNVQYSSLKRFRVQRRTNLSISSVYKSSEVEEITEEAAPLSDAQLVEASFPYSYLRFEDTPDFLVNASSAQAAFTVYKGSANERLPFSQKDGFETRRVQPDVQGLTHAVVEFDGATEPESYVSDGRCLDALELARGRVFNERAASYYLHDHSACEGCACVSCQDFLVAKSTFAAIYCASECPSDSSSTENLCVHRCPPGKEVVLRGDIFVCERGRCQSRFFYSAEERKCVPQPTKREMWVMQDINGKTIVPADMQPHELAEICPVYFHTQCYKTCPHGLQKRLLQNARDFDFTAVECVECTLLGFLAYDGKCVHSCAMGDVVLAGACQAKCPAGYFAEGNRCVARCIDGIALDGKCREKVSTTRLVGVDALTYFSCPINMREFAGKCVTRCPQYTVENAYGRCSPCSRGSGYLDGRCAWEKGPGCDFILFERELPVCATSCNASNRALVGGHCLEVFLDDGALVFDLKTQETGALIVLDAPARLTGFHDGQINVLRIGEQFDCDYFAIEVDEGALFKNVLVFVNTTIDMACQRASISLFNQLGDNSNVSVIGSLTVNPAMQYSKLEFALVRYGVLQDAKLNLSAIFDQQPIEFEQNGAGAVNVEEFEQLRHITRLGSVYFFGEMPPHWQRDLQLQEDQQYSPAYALPTPNQQLIPRLNPALTVGDRYVRCAENERIVTCSDGVCQCAQMATRDILLFGQLAVSECPQGAYMLNYHCVLKCPIGYSVSFGKCIEGQDVAQSSSSILRETRQQPRQSNANIVGMQSDECIAGTALFRSVCVARCPHGQSNLDGVCDAKCFGATYAQNATCVESCADGTYFSGRECLYYCDVLAVGSRCVSACSQPYDSQCRACENGAFFNVSAQICQSFCSHKAVSSAGFDICCDESADEFCQLLIRAGSEYLVPNLQDGLLNEFDCVFMKYSAIWDGKACVADSFSDLLAGKPIVNVMAFQTVDFFDSNFGRHRSGKVIDVSGAVLSNLLIHVHITENFSQAYVEVSYSVFGTIEDAILSRVSIAGSVNLQGDCGAFSLKNVESVVGSSRLLLYSSLSLNGLLVDDHSTPGGNFIEYQTIAITLDGKTRRLAYGANFSYEQQMRMYYYAQTIVLAAQSKSGGANSITSLRPQGFDGFNMILCDEGQAFDEQLLQCVDSCPTGTVLLGSACLKVGPGTVAAQLFVNCPEYLALNEESKECTYCRPDQLYQGSLCVNKCADGLLQFKNRCLNQCPAGYLRAGDVCVQSGDQLPLELGIAVSACSNQKVEMELMCRQLCKPGFYAIDGKCYSVCPDGFLAYTDKCISGTSCSQGLFLFSHQGHDFCVFNCPQDYWSVAGRCSAKGDGECDSMGYMSQVSRRCIACNAKLTQSSASECQQCSMVNRTSLANLSEQFCARCSRYYYADAAFGLEQKVCTTQCPPLQKYLTVGERQAYNSLRFSKYDFASKTSACVAMCGADFYSHELTNRPHCYKQCSGFVSAFNQQKRCLRFCGAYQEENPVQLDGNVCSNACPSFKVYQVPDENGTYHCSASCPEEFRYFRMVGADYRCVRECNALNQVIINSTKMLCTAECGNGYIQDDGNNSCVFSCSNIGKYGNQLTSLGGSRSAQICVKECEYYILNEDQLHKVRYRCSEPCTRYYIDEQQRKVCVQVCSAYGKAVDGGQFECVGSCGEGLYAQNGICVQRCSFPFFKSRHVIDGGLDSRSLECAMEHQCADLSIEQVVIGGVQMSHCANCRRDTLLGQRFSLSGRCVARCPGYFDADYNCLPDCPAQIGDDRYFLQSADSQLCIKNCIRDWKRPDACKSEQKCDNTTSFLAVNDPLLCIDVSDNALACESGVFLNIILDKNNFMRQCLADRSRCSFSFSDGENLVCIPPCGSGEWETLPYLLQDTGCVSDCLALDLFYPTVEQFSLQQCRNLAECRRLGQYTSNSTTFSGVCATLNAPCERYYIQIKDSTTSVKKCVKQCPVIYPGQPAQFPLRCAEAPTDNPALNYLQFNAQLGGFEQVSACSDGHYLNRVESVCERVCPLGTHVLLNGSCARTQRCHAGFAIEEQYGQFVCVIIGARQFYAYDGLEFILSAGIAYEQITGTQEVRVVACPFGYFYLRGACTKLCANSSKSDCVDIFVDGNIVREGSAIAFLECEEDLVGYKVGGQLLFQCEHIVNTALVVGMSEYQGKRVGLSRYTPIFCAISLSEVQFPHLYYREVCMQTHDAQLYMSIYSDSPLKMALKNVTTQKYFLLFNLTYQMFEVQAVPCQVGFTAVEHICYKQCGQGLVNVGNECINGSGDSGVLVHYGDEQALVSPAWCDHVEDNECMLFQCPSYTFQGALVKTLYYRQQCISGCVSKDGKFCTDIAKAQIYEQKTYAARLASQCTRLDAKPVLEKLLFECNPYDECPSDHYNLSKYCYPARVFRSGSQVIKINDSILPRSTGDLFVQSIEQCQIYKTAVSTSVSEIGETSKQQFNLCVEDWENDDSCQLLQYSAELQMFQCVQSCAAGFQDYLSQGVCFPACKAAECLVEGQCVSVPDTACDGYIENRHCLALDTKTKYQRAGGFRFSIRANASLKVGSGNEFQPFLCPKTHYYFKNACFRKCPAQNSRQCADTLCNFNEVLECGDFDEPNVQYDTIFHLDYGQGETAVQYLEYQEACNAGQLSFGRYCIDLSIIAGMQDLFEAVDGCILQIDAEEALTKNLTDFCRPERCASFTTVKVSSVFSIRVCAASMRYLDDSNVLYQFSPRFGKFERVRACAADYAAEGVFCYPKCDDDKFYVFDRCIASADACPECAEYQVYQGMQFAVNAAALKYEVQRAGSGTEFAYFVCPPGYSYFDCRCYDFCPARSLTLGGLQISLCSKQCGIFDYDGQCLADCPADSFLRFYVLQQNVFYLCSQQHCTSDEYQLFRSNAAANPALCIHQTLQEIPPPPRAQVLLYDQLVSKLSAIFVDASACRLFFASPFDERLTICADQSMNLPSDLPRQLVYRFAFKMFQFSRCGPTDYEVDGICYPYLAENRSFVLDDRMLVSHSPESGGIFDIFTQPSSAMLRQGACQYYEYFNESAARCEALPRGDNCRFMYARSAFNSPAGFADEAVYFLVADVHRQDVKRVSQDSCQIITLECPVSVGYHYFENTCIRRCAQSTEYDDYAENCLEIVEKMENGAVKLNNMMVQDGNRFPVLKNLQQVQIAIVQEVRQFIEYLDVSSSVNDYPELGTAEYVLVSYNQAYVYVSTHLARSLADVSCVLGFDFAKITRRSLCVFDCAIYSTKNGISACVRGFSELTSYYYLEECVSYRYEAVRNMFECMPFSACGSRICKENCAELELFAPFVGCAAKLCANGFVFVPGTSKCEEQPREVPCSKFFVLLGEYGFQIPQCPEAFRSPDSCLCSVRVPCIERQVPFAGDCVDRWSCENVVETADPEFKCVYPLPAHAKVGNLVFQLANEEPRIIGRDQANNTLFIILIAVLAVITVSLAGAIILVHKYYRGALTNKALRKQKKSMKTGYHERLGQYLIDRPGKSGPNRQHQRRRQVRDRSESEQETSSAALSTLAIAAALPDQTPQVRLLLSEALSDAVADAAFPHLLAISKSSALWPAEGAQTGPQDSSQPESSDPSTSQLRIGSKAEQLRLMRANQLGPSGDD